jgi:hypothetical protein
VLALVAIVAACGDDDDAVAGGSCMDAGAARECRCDGGASGVQHCSADGKLGACSCDGKGGAAASGGSGGHPSRDGGAIAGGGSDASEPVRDAGGAGDAGQDTSDSDGGPGDAATASDAAMEPEPTTMPLPMTGEQLAVCTQQSDCDPGLGCYDAEGPGRAFCTRECTVEKDCADLKDADYTCSPDGLCEVDCGGGPPGVDRCPEGLVCMQVSGPGPGGIRNRCKYSTSAGTSGAAFSPCSVPEDCADGLQCLGAFLTVPGYCTYACTKTADCTTQPSSGAISASCLANTCVLSCEADMTGCPDGMTCVETPLFSQCAYQ